MLVSIHWNCCRPNLSTKTLQAKATDLSRRLLRASCDGRYFHSLNSLAWRDLSQQTYSSAMTMPLSFSDVTTFKSSAGVYISSTPAPWCVWIIYTSVHGITIYILSCHTHLLLSQTSFLHTNCFEYCCSSRQH